MTMEYGGRSSEVVTKNGVTQVVLTSPPEKKGTLIGSCIMMMDALRAAVDVLGMSLPQAVDMCASSPARIVDLGHIGTLEPGKRADLLLLSGDAPSMAPGDGLGAGTWCCNEKSTSASGSTSAIQHGISRVTALRATMVAGKVVYDRERAAS